jgi:hypothetical protein
MHFPLCPYLDTLASMSSLDQFLKSQASEGRKDSVGEFTVDMARGTEKFRRYQMADPAFYVLKLVQAAVLAKAETLEFKFTHNEVTAYFKPRGYFTCEERLPRDLMMDADWDPVMTHISKAMAGALASEKVYQVSICYRSDEGRQLTINAKGIHDERMVGAMGFTMRVRRRRSWLKNLLIPGREHSALVTRAYLAPLKLIVDGRELEPKRPGADVEYYRLCDEGRGLQVWQDLSIRYERGERGAYEDTQTRIYRDHRKLLERPRNETFYCDLLVSYPYYTHPGKGEVRFVKDGVLTSACVLSEFPQALLVVDAGDLKTDLSEFKIVEDQAFWESIESLKRQYRYAKSFHKEP